MYSATHTGHVVRDPLVITVGKAATVATQAPVPANATTDSFGNDGPWSVACPTARSCDAVGSYLDTALELQPLIVTRSGPTWTASQPPLP